MLKIQSTADLMDGGAHKVLLYAHHGFGKTYQCRNYQRRYGKGLIISGESGLKSVEDVDIPFVPFSSWDGPQDEMTGAYSFRAIIRELARPGYLASEGIQWIALDSLSELSDRLMEYLEEKHAKNTNKFDIWSDYERSMVGALKWLRDLPVHVYVTCLAKEERNANDGTEYWPLMKGSAVAKKVPALFDHVFCGMRTTEKDNQGVPRVKRYVITDEVSGWHGKTRDPRGRLKSIEKVDDVTALLDRLSAADGAPV